MRPLTSLLIYTACGVKMAFGTPATGQHGGFIQTETEVLRSAAMIDSAAADVFRRWQAELEAKNQIQGPLPSLEPAKDSDFVRRAYLDARGRIPTATEARDFLDDERPNKRARLIDHLLSGEEWSDQQFHRLADMLRITDRVLDAPQQPYIDWVKQAARNDMPLDRFAHALLTASGSLETNPATGYLLRDGGPMFGIASVTASTFLGVDFHCAACHDHPFADWTQMEFYRFAACLGATTVIRSAPPPAPASQTEEIPLFPGGNPLGKRPTQKDVSAGEILWPVPLRHPPPEALTSGSFLTIEDVRDSTLTIDTNYKYRDGKPGDWIRPTTLNLQNIRNKPRNPIPTSNSNRSRPTIRQAWADWVVREPHFARTLALRIWDQMFGLPPNVGFGIGWEPELEAESMSKVYFEAGCGVGGIRTHLRPYFERDHDVLIAEKWIGTLGHALKEADFNAREFQRILMRTDIYQRAATVETRHPIGQLLQPRLRRMTAEQAWDSIIGLDDAEKEKIPRSIHLPQSLPSTHPLRILGRGARQWSDDSVPAISFALCRLMLNGEIIHRCAQGAAREQPDVESLFLATLSRRPTAPESKAAQHFLTTESGDPAELALALIGSAEFLFVR